jgi:HSP20 family protein
MTIKSKYGRVGWLKGGTVVRRVLSEGWNVPGHVHAWEPATDVYENDRGLVVQIEIAGMHDEDFSITLHERVLVVEGVRKDAEPKRVYHQMEIRFGVFRSEVVLPWTADVEQAEATYEQGVLRVFLPRPPAHRVAVLRAEDETD